MKYNLSQIADITSGVHIGEDITCSNISHDTRTISFGDGVLFVALQGGRDNGDMYVDDAYNRHVRAFIVSQGFDRFEEYANAGFIVVESPLKALQRLAAHHRSLYKGELLAITGSNGKTIVKELIAQILGGESGIFRSPKSYNSQIGVALSLLMIEGDEKLVVIEAGISQRGEMTLLEEMIRPTTVVVTNIGDAHGENFSSKGEKLEQKMILCKGAQNIIYNSESEVAQWAQEHYDSSRLHPWSSEEHKLTYSPFNDAIYCENIHHALAALEVIGMTPSGVEQRIAQLERVNMRLELKSGIYNSEIINDSYNSDYGSLKVAIEYMESIAKGRDKVIIISDILQSGIESRMLYEKVAKLVHDAGINIFIAIGEQIGLCRELFSTSDTLFFRDTTEFLTNIDTSLFSNTITLLKGCREFQFEKIEGLLEEKLHSSVMEVNLDNLLHNLSYHRSLTQPEVKCMAMVKAQAYGLGGYKVARELEKAHVDYLAVAYADEGVELRKMGIKSRIVVLGSDIFCYRSMIENRLEPEIYSLQALEAFANQCDICGEVDYPIHIKIESGMQRLGFSGDEIESLIERVKALPVVKIASIFSHLAGSDSPAHREFTLEQIATFKRLSSIVTEAFNHKITRHICNSAAIEHFPEAHLDMVRVGIGLYGFGNPNLKVVAMLRSVISQIKEVKAGVSIGYSRKEYTTKDSKIAVISIGYADGFRRALSCGNWSVKIGESLAAVVGNICMDTCMVDVTDIECKVGDFATIFGSEPSVSLMAERLNTIEYEILTDVSQRIKRTYIKE